MALPVLPQSPQTGTLRPLQPRKPDKIIEPGVAEHCNRILQDEGGNVHPQQRFGIANTPDAIQKAELLKISAGELHHIDFTPFIQHIIDGLTCTHEMDAPMVIIINPYQIPGTDDVVFRYNYNVTMGQGFMNAGKISVGAYLTPHEIVQEKNFKPGFKHFWDQRVAIGHIGVNTPNSRPAVVILNTSTIPVQREHLLPTEETIRDQERIRRENLQARFEGQPQTEVPPKRIQGVVVVSTEDLVEAESSGILQSITAA